MSGPHRDILSTRLSNRALLLRMVARGEWPARRREVRELLEEMAADLDRDAAAAGRLEIDRGRST
jgi:hypothetical protein